MWCLSVFPQDKKMAKQIYRNKLSVVNKNKEEKEYDHVSSTTRQIFDDMLYEPSGET